VQRLLPLLDGNIASTVSNLLAPRPHPQAPPSAKLDLGPIEDGLADLRTQHERLRNQVMEQNNSLKRVEDQLEMVREATDRNTLEQQELLEALKAFGKKVKIVAIIALMLAAVGFLMTVALFVFLHIRRVLP
jgi:t-SNARE complex subunit (syntaxin)